MKAPLSLLKVASLLAVAAVSLSCFKRGGSSETSPITSSLTPDSAESRLRRAATAIRALRKAADASNSEELAQSVLLLKKASPGCLDMGALLGEMASRLMERTPPSRQDADLVFDLLAQAERDGSTDEIGTLRVQAWDRYAEFWPAEVTRSRLISLRLAMEAFSVDRGAYPVGFDVDSLLAQLAPTYLSAQRAARLRADAWGTEFRVSGVGKDYLLVSAGADRVFEPESWSTPGTELSEEADAVVASDSVRRMWRLGSSREFSNGDGRIRLPWPTPPATAPALPEDRLELAARHIASARAALERHETAAARGSLAEAMKVTSCALAGERAALFLEVANGYLAARSSPASLSIAVQYLEEARQIAPGLPGIDDVTRTTLRQEKVVAPVAATIRIMKLLSSLETPWPDGPDALQQRLLDLARKDGLVHVGEVAVPVEFLATDGWGTAIRMEYPNVISAGADRRFEPETWTVQAWNLAASNDAVYRIDRFVRGWKKEE